MVCFLFRFAVGVCGGIFVCFLRSRVVRAFGGFRLRGSAGRAIPAAAGEIRFALFGVAEILGVGVAVLAAFPNAVRFGFPGFREIHTFVTKGVDVFRAD